MAIDETAGNPSQEGSSDDFFAALEDDVNSAIQDEVTNDGTTEATLQKSDPLPVTREQEGTKTDVDWETRYKDSTREAQRMHGELSELKPFVPVLNAMKNDSGLVDHVRGYLETGGAAPKTVAEDLGLNEDFIYDSDEALKDPESDSAKVFERSVDKVVTSRVQQLLAGQAEQNKRQTIDAQRKTEEGQFKKDNDMTEEQFASMMEKANKHVMTLDDLHLLVNKDKIHSNTANSTRLDMLGQMKSVRDIPASASGANSAKGADKSLDDEIFDALNGTDGGIDNLFE